MYDWEGKRTDSKDMLIKVLGPVVVVVVVGWAILASLPDSDDSNEDSTEASPAPTQTLKQEKPAPPRAKSVDLTYRTRLVEAQKLLKQRGLYKSKVDGIYGPGTKAALEAFQAQNGLEQTGKLDDATMARLKASVPDVPPITIPDGGRASAVKAIKALDLVVDARWANDLSLWVVMPNTGKNYDAVATFFCRTLKTHNVNSAVISIWDAEAMAGRKLKRLGRTLCQ